MSNPAISFSAYDGIAYTILPPPLPPSPSVLARPIPSSEMIDLELFTSLRIIWGRYADANGDCIRRDLCSRAGHGVYAKAFYFLLDRYRDESFRTREVDAEFESKILPFHLDLETFADFVATSESPASMSGGPRKYEVSHVFLNSQVSSTTQTKTHRSRSSSANPANVLRGLPPKIIARKRTFTSGSILTEKGRFDAAIPSNPAILPKRQTKIPTSQKDGTTTASIRPKSTALSGLGRGIGMHPSPARRGYTDSVVPEKISGDSNATLVGPSPRFSQHLHDKAKRNASSANTPSSERPVTTFGSILASAETSKITSGADSAAKMNRDPPASVGSPRSFVTKKGRSSIDPTDSGKAGLPILPPLAIEEITEQLNNLVVNMSETPVDEDAIKEGKKSNIPLAKMRRYRLREKDGKENQSLDEDWSQEVADSAGVELGAGGVLTKRDIGKDLGNRPVPLARMKKSRREYS